FKELADGCEKHSGEILPHVSTVAPVRLRGRTGGAVAYGGAEPRAVPLPGEWHSGGGRKSTWVR
ncbi:hypothetical protein, partial [Streptomyces sp. NPDC088184]|uniref:hypothetical protein n=1 Tax=Streptomyces sp. NPDC088184 TaxID=3160991 RepID=UPI00342E372B